MNSRDLLKWTLIVMLLEKSLPLSIKKTKGKLYEKFKNELEKSETSEDEDYYYDDEESEDIKLQIRQEPTTTTTTPTTPTTTTPTTTTPTTTTPTTTTPTTTTPTTTTPTTTTPTTTTPTSTTPTTTSPTTTTPTTTTPTSPPPTTTTPTTPTTTTPTTSTSTTTTPTTTAPTTSTPTTPTTTISATTTTFPEENKMKTQLKLSSDSKKCGEGFCIKTDKTELCNKEKFKVTLSDICSSEEFCCQVEKLINPEEECGNSNSNPNAIKQTTLQKNEADLNKVCTFLSNTSCLTTGTDLSDNDRVNLNGPNNEPVVGTVTTFNNGNLALVEFDEPVDSKKIATSCLPNSKMQPTKRLLDSTLANQLAEVFYVKQYKLGRATFTFNKTESVFILSTEICNALLINASSNAKEFGQLCVIGAKQQDLCKTPEGAALFYNRDGRQELVGIARLGVPCGNPKKPIIFWEISAVALLITQVLQSRTTTTIGPVYLPPFISLYSQTLPPVYIPSANSPLYQAGPVPSYQSIPNSPSNYPRMVKPQPFPPYANPIASNPTNSNPVYPSGKSNPK